MNRKKLIEHFSSNGNLDTQERRRYLSLSTQRGGISFEDEMEYIALAIKHRYGEEKCLNFLTKLEKLGVSVDPSPKHLLAVANLVGEFLDGCIIYGPGQKPWICKASNQSRCSFESVPAPA